jgi:hypothetical protein
MVFRKKNPGILFTIIFTMFIKLNCPSCCSLSFVLTVNEGLADDCNYCLQCNGLLWNCYSKNYWILNKCLAPMGSVRKQLRHKPGNTWFKVSGALFRCYFKAACIMLLVHLAHTLCFSHLPSHIFLVNYLGLNCWYSSNKLYLNQCICKHRTALPALRINQTIASILMSTW